jgi:hypothetical protein
LGKVEPKPLRKAKPNLFNTIEVGGDFVESNMRGFGSTFFKGGKN